MATSKKQEDRNKNFLMVRLRNLPAVNDDDKVSRRKLLAAGAVAVGAIAVNALPKVAKAADGDPLVIGQNNAGTAQTTLESSAGTAFYVKNNSNDEAIVGEGYWGVTGTSSEIKTIEGFPPPVGVRGIYIGSENDDSAFGTAIRGVVFSSVEPGGPVIGERGVGVVGISGESNYWQNPSEVMGAGVVGEGSRKGVFASSTKGRALDVRGKAYFSSSGYDIIPEGSTNKIVSGVALDENALVLVTLQSSAGHNVYVSYAQKISDTSFEVRLNRGARQEAKFAWFIIN